MLNPLNVKGNMGPLSVSMRIKVQYIIKKKMKFHPFRILKLTIFDPKNWY